MENKKIYGILGYPLGHSLSPALHNWAFAQLGHDGIFNTYPTEPVKLKDFISSVRALRICGLCVTIPHKESIMPMLDVVSARAKSIGAVNTLYWRDGKLYGENTDVDGFKLPLINRPKAKTALVLGAGGAARAVLMGLRELGIQDIYISNRHLHNAQVLAQDFQAQVIDWHERESILAQWIINTTPLGMKGDFENISPFDFAHGNWHEDTLAYDLVYNPLETKFLKSAKNKGLKTQDGLDMFVGQALAQMKYWHGSCVNAELARNFLLKTLVN